MANLLIIGWAFFALFILYEIYDQFRYKRWLQKLETAPFPYEDIIKKLPLYECLDENLKKVLHFKILRFIEEKQFIGVDIEVDIEKKVIIAFYSCLPTIAYKYFCYPSLEYIYIYPHTIIKKHMENNGGIVNKAEFLISGESVGEAVVIAWNEAKREIFHYKKRNVIIHEFAHELDFEEGMIDGIPPIENREAFAKVTDKYFHMHKTKKFIDNYAFTNKAEFFAVVSEYYFLKPRLLKTEFPELFNEFKKVYKVDTVKCM